MNLDTPPNSPTQGESKFGRRMKNFLIAMVAIVLGAALLLGLERKPPPPLSPS